MDVSDSRLSYKSCVLLLSSHHNLHNMLLSNIIAQTIIKHKSTLFCDTDVSCSIFVYELVETIHSISKPSNLLYAII